MSDWKQEAIDAYERSCEEAELAEVEQKKIRIENAREKLVAALRDELGIPLPDDAEVRVEDHEDDLEIGAIPFVTVDDVEFTFGPNGTGKHGGGVGIVTTCPRCQQRVRSNYIYDKVTLGRELSEPFRVSHNCQTEEDRALDAQIAEHTGAIKDSPSLQLCEALCDLIDLRIEQRTGAA